jgi:aerobic-type carbon monoxide dehydrogenase small subunit (CoxS/CutS family)
MADLLIQVNGTERTISAAPDTPLLYVLSNQLRLQGPRFGCGLGQCGSCSVLVDGVEKRSCLTPVSAVVGSSVTTLEGIPGWYAEKANLSGVPRLHPVQQAFLDEQAPQCGYCYNGIVVKAVELLTTTPRPTEAEIRSAMNGHLCRCGTYPRIVRAVQRASQMMTPSGGTR